MIGVKPLALEPSTCRWLTDGFGCVKEQQVYGFSSDYADFHYSSRRSLPRTAELTVHTLETLGVDEVVAYRGDQQNNPLRRLRFYPQRVDYRTDHALHNRIMMLIPRRGFRGALLVERKAFANVITTLHEMSSRFCDPEAEYLLRVPGLPLIFRLCHHHDVHVIVQSADLARAVLDLLDVAGASVRDFG